MMYNKKCKTKYFVFISHEKLKTKIKIYFIMNPL